MSINISATTIENRKQNVEKVFPNKFNLITVIHAKSLKQVLLNVELSIESQVAWVFLVNHWDVKKWYTLTKRWFMDIFLRTKREFPFCWIGINELNWMDKPECHFRSSNLIQPDGVRVDDPQIKEVTWIDCWDKILNKQKEIWWNWIYFGGVAFKGQHMPSNMLNAIKISKKYMDVITTSWPWTGKSASRDHLRSMKDLVWDFPIALASWVSKSNVSVPLTLWYNFLLVATSISKDFYNLDVDKTKELADIINDENGK